MKEAGKPGKKSASGPAPAGKHAKFKASKVDTASKAESRTESDAAAEPTGQEVGRASVNEEAGAGNAAAGTKVGFGGEEHQPRTSQEARTSLSHETGATLTAAADVESGPRKSADEGAPRSSSVPPAVAAAEGEIPVPEPGEEGVPGVPGPVSSEVRPAEDANANKPEKEAHPEPPRPSTVGGESAAELAGGPMHQGEGGNLEKVLESYFAKDATTVQKPAQRGRRPRQIYENTYRLTPPKPFSVQVVERCIQLTLNEMLGPFLYNTNEAGELAGKIAEKIRSRVMSCRFERFKIIVLVTIGQMKRQGLHIGFRNVWDPNHDSYAVGEFKNTRVYGSAQVFGIYFD